MKISILAAATCVQLLLAMPAQAQLLGQTLTIQRLYPTTSIEYGPQVTPGTVTVETGPSDNATWGGLLISPEASAITFTYPGAGGQYIGSGTTFDGFGIKGFSFSPTEVTVADNSTGYQVELSAINNTLYIDLNGTNNVGGSFSIVFAPVPEPTTYALFSIGLATVGFLARRRRKG